MDVGAWLRSLGLERYEQAFRDNEIDVELLPKLTADDLKELGVALVGHRRRLLDAIAALRGEAEAANRPRRRMSRPPTAPASGATRRRAAAAHGDVRRPGRLDRALGRGSTPRRCARSCAPTRTRSRARSRASTATSPSSWATACWPTSAGRGRTRTRPSAPCGPVWRSSRPSAGSPPRPASRSRRGSASRPASWSWATSSARVRRARRRWSARRRTWRRGCRRRPRPARW